MRTSPLVAESELSRRGLGPFLTGASPVPHQHLGAAPTHIPHQVGLTSSRDQPPMGRGVAKLMRMDSPAKGSRRPPSDHLSDPRARQPGRLGTKP